MNISDELIDNLQSLAKITLTDTEREKVKNELQELLEYMKILDGLGTDGAELLSHILSPYSVFREDEVKPSVLAEDLLSNAPETKDGCFAVPKSLE